MVMNEKKALFVCTHGQFGEEIVRSMEMIVGKSRDIFVFSLLREMSPEGYRQEISAKLEELTAEGYTAFICLVDLFGGSPCMTLVNFVRDYNLKIVTGLNLAMLIEVYTNLGTKPLDGLVDYAMTTLLESGKKLPQ